MATGSSVHGMVAERLREVGQRYTTVRRAIVDVLYGASRPLTIAEILAAGPALAQSSVYRTLSVLEDAAVVHRLPGPGGFTRYELAETLTEHHHHLVCVSCGAVEDVPASGQLERTVAVAAAEAVAGKGFRPHGHRLDLVGVCARCS